MRSIGLASIWMVVLLTSYGLGQNDCEQRCKNVIAWIWDKTPTDGRYPCRSVDPVNKGCVAELWVALKSGEGGSCVKEKDKNGQDVEVPMYQGMCARGCFKVNPILIQQEVSDMKGMGGTYTTFLFKCDGKS